MKIKSTELIIVIILSVVAWTVISMSSIPLDSTESILLVGVILVLVYTIGFIIRKYGRREKL